MREWIKWRVNRRERRRGKVKRENELKERKGCWEDQSGRRYGKEGVMVSWGDEKVRMMEGGS